MLARRVVIHLDHRSRHGLPRGIDDRPEERCLRLEQDLLLLVPRRGVERHELQGRRPAVRLDPERDVPQVEREAPNRTQVPVRSGRDGQREPALGVGQDEPIVGEIVDIRRDPGSLYGAVRWMSSTIPRMMMRAARSRSAQPPRTVS